MTEAGRWLIVIGLLVVMSGLLLYFWGNHFRWIGHLPGDIRIEKENFRFYFPLTTMVILSLLVNVVVRLVRWSWQWMN